MLHYFLPGKELHEKYCAALDDIRYLEARITELEDLLGEKED